MKQYQSDTRLHSLPGLPRCVRCDNAHLSYIWVIWGNAHRQNAVEPDTGMPIIAPADSTAEAPTEPATVLQQEQEPESVIEEQPVAAAEPEPAVTQASAPVWRAAGVRSCADAVFG